MRKMSLRRLPRVSYYEPEEPAWDEHVFCEKCGDYVYEYCSIHGPLLVVPDDKVPTKSPYPPFVPRAALTIPHVFLHIAPSIIPGAGLGIFSTLTLPCGVRFGPYRGAITTDIDSMYCWQIYDREHRTAHVVDARDPNRSNWMRYVNCARHCSEQNLVAYQYRGHIYYRTIKVVPKFTELLVFYGGEFACMLGIDLSLYNVPPDEARAIVELRKKRKAEEGAKKAKQQKVIEVNKENLPSNIVDQNPKNNCQPSEDNVVVNVPNDKKNISNSDVEIDSNAKNVYKDEQIVDPVVNEHYIVSKTTCKFCSEESESEIYTRCTPKKVETIAPCNSLDNRRVVNKTSIVDDDKKKYSCDICQKKFVRKDTSKVHLRRHTGEKPYACNICQNKFVRKAYLKVHLRRHTGEKPYACNICQDKFVTKGDLKQHLRRHTGEKPYACNICQDKFVTKAYLKEHLRRHTGEKPYACNICQDKFVTKAYLKEHLRRHTGEKPYACNICQNKFVRKAYLKVHLRRHTGEKPYACNICQDKFVTKGDLKQHLRRHTGEKPYACNICQDKFVTKAYLKEHLRRHTGEKPYACNICQDKFVTKGDLKQHLRRHTGEKPYACNICQNKFVRKAYLKEHLRRHTGEKPYACNICQNKFVTKGKLKEHLRRHTGEKPYACNLCEYRCSMTSNLKLHIKNKHTKEKNVHVT